jgi:hypothetical protein
VPGESLALVGGKGAVWQLNFAKSQPKVYFDPLGTVAGKSLTWNAPADHAWHHGLWFSWKTINDVNYWEFDGTGKPAGTTELVDVVIDTSREDERLVTLKFVYHPAGDDRNVMSEAVKLRMELPRTDGSYRIDWQQLSTALVDLQLDRTPPPGRPGGVAHGGYGGLSYRGARNLENVVMIDSEGRQDMQTHREPARWLDATGTVDGESAGLAIFDHPKNPRHPTPWFVVRDRTPLGPFWYTNPALLCWEPYGMKSGETLELNYRILVHEGKMDVESLEAEWKSFAEQGESSSTLRVE